MKRTKKVLGTIFAAGALTAAMTLCVFAAQITEEKAKSIALEHAGVNTKDVLFINTESDYEKGRPVYDVEFMTSDYTEYDYEIDKDTGEILSWDYDAEYDFLAKDRQQDQSGRSASGISLEEAKTIALKHAGLNAADVVWGKVKQDYDDGRLIFEGEFYSGLMEYEFEIDAASGTVIDWEMERD